MTGFTGQTNVLIGSSWISTGKTFEVINPFSGKPVAGVATTSVVGGLESDSVPPAARVQATITPQTMGVKTSTCQGEGWMVRMDFSFLKYGPGSRRYRWQSSRTRKLGFGTVKATPCCEGVKPIPFALTSSRNFVGVLIASDAVPDG